MASHAAQSAGVNPGVKPLRTPSLPISPLFEPPPPPPPPRRRETTLAAPSPARTLTGSTLAGAPPTPPPKSPDPDPAGPQRRWRQHQQLEQATRDFQTFISFIFSISIFGASIFAVVAGQMTDPATIWDGSDGGGRPPFTLRGVRTLLGSSWLCFVLSIALSGYSSSILTIARQQASSATHPGEGGGDDGLLLPRYDDRWARRWTLPGVVASVVMHLLVVSAFMFLSLALAAYAGAVGWFATGCCAVVGVFVICLLVYQVV